MFLLYYVLYVYKAYFIHLLLHNKCNTHAKKLYVKCIHMQTEQNKTMPAVNMEFILQKYSTNRRTDRQMQWLHRNLNIAYGANLCGAGIAHAALMTVHFTIMIVQGDCWICMELMSICLDQFYRFVHGGLCQRIPESILGRITLAVSGSCTCSCFQMCVCFCVAVDSFPNLVGSM